MTKTIEQARREAFEAWYVQHAIAAGVKTTITDMAGMRGKDGEYRGYPVLHGKWIGYSAALDSLYVELPPKYTGHDGYGIYDAIDIQEAIHAAGVKTK